MKSDEERTDLGTIRIHKNVISSIASMSAQEIEGVVRVGGDFKSGIVQLFNKKSAWVIKVEISKSGEVKIELPVVIKYGFNLPDIANKIQENVRNNLEKMTDLSIKDINVNVQGIERGQ